MSEETLGRYRLLQMLGAGGMGQVHLAVATGPSGFEKLVALKVLGADADAARARSLIREALIGVRFDHSNVVQILDFGEDNNKQFIAMEYVRGFTLSHVIQHGRRVDEPTPLQPTVYVVRRIAAALQYIHELRGRSGDDVVLIHGDVSPSNILLGIDGRVKLTDFGIAALNTELQRAERVAGKPAYLPPEAFSGAPHTQQWDVYALAAVLYHAITGQSAHEGSNANAVRKSMAEGITPVHELRAGCPAELATVVERGVASDPMERYATAAEFRDALEAAFPRQIDDADVHQQFIAQIFADERFVKEHGELPSTEGVASTADLTPYVTDSEELTRAVRRLPALRFGLSPAMGPELARSYGQHIAGIFTARLGRDVRAIVFADYAGLVDCLVRGEVDMAWMPPVPFLSAADRGAGVLVMAERFGRKTFDSAIITAADSGIQTLDDVRGESVAWVDRSSASGYLFPGAQVRRALDAPLAEALGRQHFHGSHRAVCEAVANGWASVGATFATREPGGKVIASGWHDLLGERVDEIRAISFAGPIPADNIAHRPHLSVKLIDSLREMMTELARSKRGRTMLEDVFNAHRFVPGDLELYDSVREALSVEL